MSHLPLRRETLKNLNPQAESFQALETPEMAVKVGGLGTRLCVLYSQVQPCPAIKSFNANCDLAKYSNQQPCPTKGTPKEALGL